MYRQIKLYKEETRLNNTPVYRIGGNNGLFKNVYLKPDKSDGVEKRSPIKRWNAYNRKTGAFISSGKISDLVSHLRKIIVTIN